jgi:cephalosporin hydroxylase
MDEPMNMAINERLIEFMKSTWRFALRLKRKPQASYDVRPFLRSPDPYHMQAEAKNEMETVYYSHTGRQSFKWHHYLEIYDRHLSKFRNTPVKLLEIGVQYGGSLQIWRRYFGPTATIFGIDINPDCSKYSDSDASVRIGSQNDPAFLNDVVLEMRGVDVIIDDGGHVARHQSTSFNTLFPLLSDGGVYICEDISTSYWRVYHDGGYKRPGTFVELCKQIIDDLHGWYHSHPVIIKSIDAPRNVYSLCVYDSIVVFEKRKKERPFFCGMPPAAGDR